MPLREMRLEDGAPTSGYPFDLPALRALPLRLAEGVTVLVGENGSGKSTLVEALAVAAGFNAEGGSGQVRFSTEATHSALADHVRLVWSGRLPAGWFLRAESFYNLATHRDLSNYDDGEHRLPPVVSYHGMSHGESFLQVAADWFRRPALFVLDEPEAALSFTGQLGLVHAMLDGVDHGAQFVVATHSPLLMAFPGAALHELTAEGATRREYDDLEVVALWRSFLDDPGRFLHHLR